MEKCSVCSSSNSRLISVCSKQSHLMCTNCLEHMLNPLILRLPEFKCPVCAELIQYSAISMLQTESNAALNRGPELLKKFTRRKLIDTLKEDSVIGTCCFCNLAQKVPVSLQTVLCFCGREFLVRCNGHPTPGTPCRPLSEGLRDNHYDACCPLCGVTSARAAGCSLICCKSDYCQELTYYCQLCKAAKNSGGCCPKGCFGQNLPFSRNPLK